MLSSKVSAALYAGIRPLALLDITLLLHGSRHELVSIDLPSGYRAHYVSPMELRELRRKGSVDPRVGTFPRDSASSRLLAGLCHGKRMVSFVWMANGCVPADQNFSRATHLGTSITLPATTRFIYNLWTDPDHRGRGLAGSLLHWAINRSPATEAPTDSPWEHVAATVDWSNAASRRAFEKLGMRSIGPITRFGRGRFQLSLLPGAAREVGLSLADDAPGFKYSARPAAARPGAGRAGEDIPATGPRSFGQIDHV